MIVPMIRTVLMFAALAAVAASSSTAGEPAGPDAFLAQVYTFGAVEAEPSGCLVTLDARSVAANGHAVRRARINSRCRQIFPSLRRLSRWKPTGGASLSLLGGNPLRTMGDFSPVQDATGVYLRGGISGDHRVYELRTLASARPT